MPHCRKTWQPQFTAHRFSTRYAPEIIDMAMNGVGCRATARIMGVGLNTILRHLKLRPQSVTRAYSRAVTSSICAEMDEQWGYVELNRASAGCLTRMTVSGRRLLRTYSVNAPMATLGRLMSLLSPFDVVIWMTDGWPLHESRLKGKLHVISKRYTQRIERHNLNLRQHLARLGRKSLSFSKSVELHDKVIGHYLNINTINKLSHYPILLSTHFKSLRNHYCRHIFPRQLTT
ncbi:IS1 family transposase [Escherichia coli]|nr:IS1 family transposase [Escherichia coli]